MSDQSERVPAYLAKDDGSGESWFIQEAAVAELLDAEILFVNSRPYCDLDWSKTPPVAHDPPRVAGHTLVLFVHCNDLFWWACADAENCELHELKGLYDIWKARGDVGAEQWCCYRRKMRPQTPIEKQWREKGQWTPELEALPSRGPKECG